MKRKTSTIPTKIYKYGLPFGPDKECAQLVHDSIWLSHRYYNELVVLEKTRREEYRAEREKVAPGFKALKDKIGKLDKKLKDVRKRIKKERQGTRTRKTDPELRAKAKELVEQLRGPKMAFEAAKIKIEKSKRFASKVKKLNEQANKDEKTARAACGVYWGTYIRIEKAIESAKKSRTDPDFHRWNDKGSIGVQIQKGMSVDALFSCEDTRLRIEPVPADTWTGSRAKRRRQSRTRVHIRMGSQGKRREPLWASFNLILHRPLPDDGVIKNAWVQKRRIGLRLRWELCITLESRTFVVPSVDIGRTCGIDVGWRKMDEAGTLRVAYVVGSDGYHEEILTPSNIWSALDYANDLRSLQDHAFDEAKERLMAWMKGKRRRLPKWLKEKTSHLHMWRSSRRMAKLVWKWKKSRFSGDEEIMEMLLAWRRRYRHLYGWECNQRSKAEGRRNEHYRVIAHRLAQRYGTFVLEDFDLRKMSRSPEVEDEDEMSKGLRRQKSVAAVSEFRAALKLAASNAGASIIPRPSPYTTMMCHACGKICYWNAEKHLCHTCEHCGVRWDQDANAGTNLLAAAEDPEQQQAAS